MSSGLQLNQGLGATLVIWRRYRQESEVLPEVAEPLDELGRVVLVELNVRKVDFEDGGTWVSNVEEHQLRLAQVHWGQGAGVEKALVKVSELSIWSTNHSYTLIKTIIKILIIIISSSSSNSNSSNNNNDTCEMDTYTLHIHASKKRVARVWVTVVMMILWNNSCLWIVLLFAIETKADGCQSIFALKSLSFCLCLRGCVCRCPSEYLSLSVVLCLSFRLCHWPHFH